MYGYLFQLYENTLSILQLIYKTLYKNMKIAVLSISCSKNNRRRLEKITAPFACKHFIEP